MDNLSPKKNPYTTIPGIFFILISVLMFLIKYVLPAFIVLKQEIEYAWYAPLMPCALGVLLIFMNDQYFSRLFNRGEKIIAKKTDTEDK